MRIVGGAYRGRPLAAPAARDGGKDVRPTSDRARQAVFNILEHGLDGAAGLAGASVLDLFAGSGALGLEALSRGAAHVTFVEIDGGALKCIRRNSGAMGAARAATLLKLDAARLPPPPLAARAPCAVAFLDPPYNSGLAAPALGGLAAKGWIGPGSVCVVEVAAKEDLTPPVGFAEIDARTYGAARVVFLGFEG